MNFETACALFQLEEIFARYEIACDFAKGSKIFCSLPNLSHEAWDAMEAEFDMRVQLCDASVFRYFLPRLLEWFFEIYASESSFGWPDSWDISGALNRSKWLEWPAEEIEMLRAVFEAWSREELAKYDGKMPIEFLTEIGEDLTPHLEMWLDARPHEVAKWLFELDWKNHPREWQWALNPRVEAALEAAFFEHPDGEWGRVLARAVDLVRSLRG